MRKLAKAIFTSLIWLLAALAFLWTAGAIFHFDLFPHWLAVTLCIAYMVAISSMLMRRRIRPHWPVVIFGSLTSVFLLTLIQQPTHWRDWALEQERLAKIEFDGETMLIRNFRHAEYRSETDFDVHYKDVEFKLKDLKRVWFIVQYFSASEGLAHAFLSFEIQESDEILGVDLAPKFFSVSVEIRRESEEFYSPITGLYREYELNYVIGDERDLIGVRTVMRKDDRLHMYPVNANEAQVQMLFRDIAKRVNEIDSNPEFYHTFMNNCLNNLVGHTSKLTVEPINWLDSRIVMPGYSDRYAWEKGIIGDRTAGSFSRLKADCRIDQKARESGISDDFSLVLRDRKKE
jgi:hypothetical protein